jgi:hypothetical protein
VIDRISCSGLESCLLHLELAQERFPRRSLVYSVMRVMGVVRRLSLTTRKTLEVRLQDILVALRCASGIRTGNSPRATSFVFMDDPGLGDDLWEDMSRACPVTPMMVSKQLMKFLLSKFLTHVISF